MQHCTVQRAVQFSVVYCTALDRDFCSCCCMGEHTCFVGAKVVAAVLTIIWPGKGNGSFWILLKSESELTVLAIQALSTAD